MSGDPEIVDEERVPALAKHEVSNSSNDEAVVEFKSIDKSGLNWRLSFAIFAAAFGSAFQHGYNTGVVNAPQTLIMSWIRRCNSNDSSNDAGLEGDYSTTTPIVITDDQNVSNGEFTPMTDINCEMSESKVTFIWASIVAIFCIGGMIGGSAVGLVSTKLGRKGGMLINNVFVVIASILFFVSKDTDSYETIIAGRFFIGLCSGLNAGITPMYLSEIAPVALRGAIGTIYQLIITISILLSQILGMNNVLGTENGWPYLFALTIIPGILQVLTLPFCPESPKYLLLDKKNVDCSEKALKWLRMQSDVQTEIDEMTGEGETAKHLPTVTLTEMVRNTSLRQPLIIATAMMIIQQLTGINAVIFYSTSIFKSANLDDSAAQSATLGMGAMNVIMTFVSLALIEIAGRKTLMLIGLAIMFCSTILLLFSILLVETIPALSYVAVVMVILYVIGFATGPGSIPWFFVTELFAQSGRPIATSIAVCVNWIANFLVGLGFAPLQLAIGPYVFIIFIVFQISAIAYVFFKVPETKNKSIEEITAIFKRNN